MQKQRNKKPLKILRSTFRNGLEEAVKLWLDEEYI